MMEEIFLLFYNISAGIFFYCSKTSRYLYLLRSESFNWSIVGGKIHRDETLLEGLRRESLEEIGLFFDEWKLVPIQKFENNGGFVYHTFYCKVEEEFIPQLNEEHLGYAWVSKTYPKPLHPGLFSTINIDIIVEKLELLAESN